MPHAHEHKPKSPVTKRPALPEPPLSATAPGDWVAPQLLATAPGPVRNLLEALTAEVTAMRALAQLRLDAAKGAASATAWPEWQAAELQRQAAEAAAVAAGQRLPLPELVARYGLSAIQRQILVALLAPHVDAGILSTYRELRGGGWWDGVDLRLLLLLVADDLAAQIAVRRALAPHGTLRTRRLVAFHPARSSPSMLHWEVEIQPRLVHFLIGDALLGGPVAEVCERVAVGVPIDRVVLPRAQGAHGCTLMGQGDTARLAMGDLGNGPLVGDGEGVVLLFAGPPGTGKTFFARALGCAFARPILRARNELLLTSDQVPQLVDALQLEAELEHAILLIEDCELLLAERGAVGTAMLGLLERIRTPVILTTNRVQLLDPAVDRHVLYRLDFAVPGAAEREILWETHLPPDAPLGDDIDLPKLASRYSFSGGGVRQAVLAALHLALQRDAHRPLIDMATLLTAADTQLRASLDDYTLQMPAKRTLDDIVLPEDVLTRVKALLGACRHRLKLMTDWGFGQKLTTGLGIVALFDGPPGTGKTLCAEIIGAELGAPVARINLPSVVSKWVGETEQRIADIFKRARSTGAILLFDEADSLFGRRVAETHSATDRYANMEVNLLLQEVERYEGIVLLTTNLVGGLDPAVLRRIHFRISFPEQDAALRGQIFRTLVPRRTPIAPDVDFAELGRRFDLPGGRIQNAVLRAGYLALTEQAQRVTMAHFVSAATEEAQAAGKVIRGDQSAPVKRA